MIEEWGNAVAELFEMKIWGYKAMLHSQNR